MTSTFKSYGFSLFLHATLLCTLYAVPLSKSQRFSSAGQSQVIAVATDPSEPIELTINVEMPQPPAPTESAVEATENQTRNPAPIVIPEPVLPEPSPTAWMTKSLLHEMPQWVPDQPPSGVRPSTLTATKLRRVQQNTPLVIPEVIDPIKNSSVRPPVQTTSNDRPTVLATNPVKPNVGFKKNESADLTNNPPPPYPREAIKKKLQGTVLLRLEIAKTGKVSRAEVIRSSGHAILDRAAVDAVAAWTGKPARRWGRPIDSTEVLPLKFRL